MNQSDPRLSHYQQLNKSIQIWVSLDPTDVRFFVTKRGATLSILTGQEPCPTWILVIAGDQIGYLKDEEIEWLLEEEQIRQLHEERE